MEEQILQLLTSDETSQANKYRNNVQYAKKPYPLSKIKVKKGKSQSSKRELTKGEREPLIESLAKNFARLESLLIQGGTEKQVLQEDELCNILLQVNAFAEQKCDSAHLKTFSEQIQQVVSNQSQANAIYLASLVFKHRITHDLLIQLFPSSQLAQAQFAFLFESMSAQAETEQYRKVLIYDARPNHSTLVQMGTRFPSPSPTLRGTFIRQRIPSTTVQPGSQSIYLQVLDYIRDTCWVRTQNQRRRRQFVRSKGAPQSIYILLLLILKKQSPLGNLLPKKKQLLAWLDVLSEIAFLNQTLAAARKYSSKRAITDAAPVDDTQDERIEKAINKISSLLEREAREQTLLQELCGNLEAITENVEIMRACARKEDVKQSGSAAGEIIRDEIAI